MKHVKASPKDFNVWIKILFTLTANFIISLAMALMLHSNVGADPVTVLIDGISRIFRISEGSAAAALSGVFFLFALCFNREQIKGATIISVLTLGPFMDTALSLVQSLLPSDLPLIACLIEAVVGACALGLSIGAYLSLHFGASPTDSMMLWFHKILHLDYQYCTWIFYSISLVLGILMGGVVGIGTIFSLFLVGVCSNFILRKLQLGIRP